MGTSGLLEQLPFTEFIQTLANLGKSGRVTLARFAERGSVILRRGQIVGAASSTLRETLGSLLVGQELITENELKAALERQSQRSESRLLGRILVDEGILTEDQLGHVVHQQTRRVIGELMTWKYGFIEFEPCEIEDENVIGTEAAELMLGEGISAESLILAGAVEIDHHEFEAFEASEELGGGGKVPEVRSSPVSAPIEPRAESAGTGFETVAQPTQSGEDRARLARAVAALPLPPETEAEKSETGRRIASLRDLMAEIRSPEFTGELTTRIMEYTTEILGRSVLFSVQSGQFCGMGYYSSKPVDQSTLEAVRELRIPVGEPSLLADVAARHQSYKGGLPDVSLNRRIIDCLGSVTPQEVVAIPLIADSRVLMVLYGDSASGEKAIGSIAELELLMLQTGLLMEREQLRSRGERPGDGTASSSAGFGDFRTLVDLDPEPIVLVDPDLQVLFANQAMGETLAEPASDLVGTDLLEAVHPQDGSDLREVVHEISQGGAPSGNTVRFKQADGTWRRTFLLPSVVGVGGAGRSVMLRALTSRQVHRRHDPLTGFFNHEALIDQLARRITRIPFTETDPFAVLMLGIDRFTLINKHFSWAVGNEILCAVANRLSEQLRPSDVVSRVEGDRFCVILDRIRSKEDSTLVAERMAKLLAEPFEVSGEEMALSISIGVVESDPVFTRATEMLAAAEGAMFRAKASHGTSVEVHVANGEE